MITRGEIKGQVLRLLNKSAQNKGFYTDEKINDAIQEACDLLATQMMLADQGWQTKLTFLDTQDGQVALEIPSHVVLIKDVRIKQEDDYVPMAYDERQGRTEPDPQSGSSGYGGSYRIIDNALYFTPALPTGTARGIMLEHMSFPKVLQDDEDFIEAHFHAAFRHFIKYRTASILSASFGSKNPPWSDLEADWTAKVVEMIPKRNMQSTYIRDFLP